jgi:methylphosphotriester-DNA--protein-cysteine methyltransferase
MINHTDFENNEDGKQKLRELIRGEKIVFAGNKSLKIYGLFSCTSGKRMHRKNRIFFSSADEATREGYRPCGHCMPVKYAEWKKEISQKKRK